MRASELSLFGLSTESYSGCNNVFEYVNFSLSHLMTQKSMVFTIGDEENPPDGEDKGSSCRHCYGPSHDMGVTGIFRKQDSYPSVDSPEIKNHKKRHTGANGYYPVYSRVRDGPLNPENVYTAYLDAVIGKTNIF